MKKNYGLTRVLEPRGAVPATAWKVSNDSKICAHEIKVNVERVHIEWDSFQQICNSCTFEEAKIKKKIIDIIEKRGKLHNPFTGTGGTLTGTVVEMGREVSSNLELKKGDRICSLTSLCGIPLKIDSIEEIDYNNGQIKCTGHAIFFETSPIYKIGDELNPKYTMVALNEAGCLLSVCNLAKNRSSMDEFTIIGGSPCTVMLYGAAAKRANPNCKVTAITEIALKDEGMSKVIEPFVDREIFLDVGDPIDAYKVIKNTMGKVEPDMVVVTENIIGAETLAVLMAKDKGTLYFTTVNNKYAIAQTVAESIEKELDIHAYDQYKENYADFTISLLKESCRRIRNIDDVFGKTSIKWMSEGEGLKRITIKNAGKEDDFVYKSKITKKLVDDAINIAKYDCNVIIQGETGVGKEKILSLIHQNSERNSNPCIKINCATIHENLAESEFFGYEAGSFTGATAQGKKGYFELANNGILFLDEIGSLSKNMQSKLLRVLQENTFYRVGGTKQISVNVRVIVANNVPIKKLVDLGEFREDLYYRLNICNINVPPLRERKEDIGVLAKAFTSNWAQKYNIERDISPQALELLRKYNWPGNVRELENVIHRLVISCKDTEITGEQVGVLLSETQFDAPLGEEPLKLETEENLDYHEIMDKYEKQLISYALEKGGTTRKAAKILGLPQTTFARKKMKHQL